MTPAWKDRVRAKLEELGKNQLWLENQIGCGRGMVTRLLTEGQQASNLVEPICRVLDIPPPMLAAESDDEREFLTLLKDATPESRDLAKAALKLGKRNPQ